MLNAFLIVLIVASICEPHPNHTLIRVIRPSQSHAIRATHPSESYAIRATHPSESPIRVTHPSHAPLPSPRLRL